MTTNDYEEMSPIFKTTVLVNKKPNNQKNGCFIHKIGCFMKNKLSYTDNQLILNQIKIKMTIKITTMIFKKIIKKERKKLSEA